MSSSNDIRVPLIEIAEGYTTKSFVLFGDTAPHKTELKNLHGKFGLFTYDDSTGEKRWGWVYSNKRLAGVSALVNYVNANSILKIKGIKTDNKQLAVLQQENASLIEEVEQLRQFVIDVKTDEQAEPETPLSWGAWIASWIW